MLDTHIHLQFPIYADDLDAVLARAAEAGVSACIVPGTDLEDSRAAIALSERYAAGPCVLYVAVGFHPTNAHLLTPDALRELRALAQHPRVVAIGEIGLDYYWPQQSRRDWPCAEPAQQRAAFERQLELAAELDLPVAIHDRDASDDTLRILRAWVAGGGGRSGVYHAYAGGPTRLEETLALGFYIGMDGPVTFPKATDLHAVARQVPLERLLLETDGPYLTPHPYRGKRNEPGYLRYVVQQIAALRDCTPESVDATTAANAHALFCIPQA